MGRIGVPKGKTTGTYSKLLQETIQWEHNFRDGYRQWNGWLPTSFQQNAARVDTDSRLKSFLLINLRNVL